MFFVTDSTIDVPIILAQNELGEKKKAAGSTTQSSCPSTRLWTTTLSSVEVGGRGWKWRERKKQLTKPFLSEEIMFDRENDPNFPTRRVVFQALFSSPIEKGQQRGGRHPSPCLKCKLASPELSEPPPSSAFANPFNRQSPRDEPSLTKK